MQRKRYAIVGALVALLALAGTALGATYPQDHDGWYLGLGVGGGSLGVSSGGSSSEREGGPMGSIRGGYPINPQVALAFESNLWTKEQDSVTLTYDATTVGAAFFPSEGLVLRGGIGFSSVEISASSGNTTASVSKTGFGFTYGIGYEFRLTRSFALGPQLDGGFASIGEDATFKSHTANWVGLGLEANWYFLRKK